MNIKNVKISFILLLISPIITLGQTIQSLSGKVINTNGQSLFGNAIVLSPEDSSILKGISFLEGAFMIEDINKSEVLLKLTSLEFQDQLIRIKYSGEEHIRLNDILAIESQTRLSEVEITADSPLIIEKPDGSIEVTVDNTALANSISTDEILSRSPNVVYNADGEIGVFGKGSATLFINGVRVTQDRLSTISPSDIDKIEIISNPGPRFDSEGNAVINIITKRNVNQGSKGTIKNYYTHSDFAGYQNRAEINYSYAKKKLALNSNYGLLLGNDRHIQRTSRTRDASDSFFNSDIKNEWLSEYDNFSNYGFGAQYDINPNSYVSLLYTGAFEDLGGERISDNEIIYEETTQYRSEVDRDDLSLKNTINANYNLTTDSVGSNLFFWESICCIQ